jgi:hypothetical protein
MAQQVVEQAGINPGPPDISFGVCAREIFFPYFPVGQIYPQYFPSPAKHI